jgi:hypothetical protein
LDGRREARRICVRGERQAARQGIEPRAVALRRDVRRHSSVVIAENIERIYKQNCQNLGVLTSTNFSLIDQNSRRAKEIALSEFTAGEDEITRQVIEYGGLFPFNVARMQGKVFLPPIKTEKRPHDSGGEDFCPAHDERKGRGWSVLRL